MRVHLGDGHRSPRQRRSWRQSRVVEPHRRYRCALCAPPYATPEQRGPRSRTQLWRQVLGTVSPLHTGLTCGMHDIGVVVSESLQESGIFSPETCLDSSWALTHSVRPNTIRPGTALAAGTLLPRETTHAERQNTIDSMHRCPGPGSRFLLQSRPRV